MENNDLSRLTGLIDAERERVSNDNELMSYFMKLSLYLKTGYEPHEIPKKGINDERISELIDIITRTQMLCDGLQYAEMSMNADIFRTTASGAFSMLASDLEKAYELADKIA